MFRRNLSLAKNIPKDLYTIETFVDKSGKILRKTKTNSTWESVIGLEVHAQIDAKSKMFSPAPTTFNSPVNSNVTYFDAAVPGTLPVLNKRCVEAGILTSLALGAELQHVSYFDRKHYFYADLPAGYQITQQRKPLSLGGCLQFPVDRNQELGTPSEECRAPVIQLQLEQDSGKSLHDEDRSLIDLNRAGIGLMEIVFGPCLSHGEQAAGLVKELVLLLRRLRTCQARMDRGQLRVDANISVRRPGGELGVRTEVKNINSVRAVAKAIEFEVERQIGLLEAGGTVENETRSWDLNSKQTLGMRDKEAKQDYRFMPEPNLPPLRLYDSGLESRTNSNMIDIAPLRTRIPKLPSEIRFNLQQEYGLSLEASSQLVSSPILLSFFEECASLKPLNMKEVANLILQQSRDEIEVEEFKMGFLPEQLVRVSNMRQEGLISYGGLSEVIRVLNLGDPMKVEDIIEAKQLYIIRDIAVIEDFAKKILNENPKLVSKYRKSKNLNQKDRRFKALISIVNKDSLVERIDMIEFNRVFIKFLDQN